MCLVLGASAAAEPGRADGCSGGSPGVGSHLTGRRRVPAALEARVASLRLFTRPRVTPPRGGASAPACGHTCGGRGSRALGLVACRCPRHLWGHGPQQAPPRPGPGHGGRCAGGHDSSVAWTPPDLGLPAALLADRGGGGPSPGQRVGCPGRARGRPRRLPPEPCGPGGARLWSEPPAGAAHPRQPRQGSRLRLASVRWGERHGGGRPRPPPAGRPRGLAHRARPAGCRPPGAHAPMARARVRSRRAASATVGTSTTGRAPERASLARGLASRRSGLPRSPAVGGTPAAPPSRRRLVACHTGRARSPRGQPQSARSGVGPAMAACGCGERGHPAGCRGPQGR